MNEVIKPSPAPIVPPKPNPSPTPVNPPPPLVSTVPNIEISDTSNSQVAGINQRTDATTRSLERKGVIPPRKKQTNPFEVKNNINGDVRANIKFPKFPNK
jgi:hypothetical protein